MSTPQARDRDHEEGRTAAVRRRRANSSPLARIGMAVFAVGLLAIVADVVLFAAGSRDLPLWVNLTAMLAPLGLALGLVAVFLENRRPSRTS